jgi:hypothetical protein
LYVKNSGGYPALCSRMWAEEINCLWAQKGLHSATNGHLHHGVSLFMLINMLIYLRYSAGTNENIFMWFYLYLLVHKIVQVEKELNSLGIKFV